MHQSIATIDSPEFINLRPLDINPLMSECEIKVLYVGANRNRSFISKEVATKIGETLRGAPIVGYYKESKEDFADHGEKLIIDDEGIHFECQTVPYGFVSPDAKVWFQDFEDHDNMGNSVVHTYLMTTGYLWTSQFPESSLPVNEGRPQSMELFDASVDGQWEYNYDKEMDYFIINDAIVSKLCILGDSVEPCFEGASVTKPEISKKFTLDDKFKNTLYSMMQDLKNVLNGGKKQMENETTLTFTEQEASVVEESSIEEAPIVNETSVSSDFAKKDDEKEKETSDERPADDKEEDGTKDEAKEDEGEEEKDDEDDKKKFTLLSQELEELKTSYSALQTQYQELLSFKTEIENQKKDALISEFYMLADEDKADVIANKEKYTLDEIKAKLSVICFDKKINFSAASEEPAVNKEEKTESILTYSFAPETGSLPDWVRMVKEEMK
jgi:hypothetical protein